jgi:hypothetical protein
MKFLKKYNESVTIFDLSDILKLNLEDNPYFDVTDVSVEPITMLGSMGKPNLDGYTVQILEIFGDDSLLWKQTYGGISARDLNRLYIKDKIEYINNKLLYSIGKKYNFRVSKSATFINNSSQEYNATGILDEVIFRFNLIIEQDWA